jgi:hypothetical protein
MSGQKIPETAIRKLVNKLNIQQSESSERVSTGGKLGEEGAGFIKWNETILKDLEQAMFIKRFIKRSVEGILSQFEGRSNDMLSEFCSDEKIFRELEESNQLDIKGSLTRFLDKLP